MCSRIAAHLTLSSTLPGTLQNEEPPTCPFDVPEMVTKDPNSKRNIAVTEDILHDFDEKVILVHALTRAYARTLTHAHTCTQIVVIKSLLRLHLQQEDACAQHDHIAFLI